MSAPEKPPLPSDQSGLSNDDLAASKRPDLQAWGLVVLLTVLNALSFMDRQVFALLLDPIGRSLQVNDFQVALLAGFAFALFYAVFGVLFGWAADRFQRRMIILAGVAIWSAATTACGLAKNFTQLALARFGVGGGEAALNPSAYSMIADAIPRHRLSFAISIFGTGVMIGGVLANLGGAALMAILPSSGVDLPWLGHMEPWRMVFILMGLPGLAMALLTLLLREPPRRERLNAKPNVAVVDALRFVWVRRGFYLPLFGAAGLIAAMNYAFSTWTAAYFIRAYSLTVSQTGVILAATQIVPQIVGLLLAGAIADRAFSRGRQNVHVWLILILSTLKATLLIAAFVSGLTVTATALLLGVATVFSGFLAMAPAALQIVTPNEFRGQITALYLFVFTLLGPGVGPVLAGGFATYVFHDPTKIGWGIAATFAALQPFAIILLIVAIRAMPRLVKASLTWRSD